MKSFRVRFIYLITFLIPSNTNKTIEPDVNLPRRFFFPVILEQDGRVSPYFKSITPAVLSRLPVP
jgi:hypothetical protein